MCGIIYIKKRNSRKRKHQNADTIAELKKAYQAQKTRGKEGFGFIALGNQDGKDWISYQRGTTETEIEKKLDNIFVPSEILFHHRYPTSTENIEECSHPIKVENKELENIFYVVHNGMINNHTTLKHKHEELGYEYNTEVTYVRTEYTEKTITKIPFEGKEGMVRSYNTVVPEKIETEYNDSEALAIELARYASGKSTEIGTYGSVAFIMLETAKDGTPLKLHFGRNEGNPLGKRNENGHLIISSQGGHNIDANTWYTYHYGTDALTEKVQDIGNFWSSTGSHSTTTGTVNGVKTIDITPDLDGGYNGYGDDWYGRLYPDLMKNRQKRLEWDRDDDSRASISDAPSDEELENDAEIWEAQCTIFEEMKTELDRIDEEVRNAQITSDFDREDGLKTQAKELVAKTREMIGDWNFDILVEQWEEEYAEDMDSVVVGKEF